jgi:hypothetical protein
MEDLLANLQDITSQTIESFLGKVQVYLKEKSKENYASKRIQLKFQEMKKIQMSLQRIYLKQKILHSSQSEGKKDLKGKKKKNMDCQKDRRKMKTEMEDGL